MIMARLLIKHKKAAFRRLKHTELGFVQFGEEREAESHLQGKIEAE